MKAQASKRSNFAARHQFARDAAHVHSYIHSSPHAFARRDAVGRDSRDAAMQALLIAAFSIARRLLRRVTRVLSLRAPPQYLNPATGATFSLDKPRWCDDASGEPQPLLVTPL